jgi:oxygen-independent coproporphyrinogen-3 oxidase
VASLYVHVPFCFHKCHYCDFYSFVDNRDRQDAFVDRLERELDALAAHAGPLRTIFVGGGTPTLLRADLWERVLARVRSAFDLREIEEFSVECNPETAGAELFDVLVAGGVDRLSFGAQSFDPRHLKTLERWHDPASVERAIELARAAGIARTSLDLIFAIPGQTLGEWSSDLERALALGTEHLSCYALTYEPNTAMTKRLSRGEFDAADHDLEADMLELTADRLHAHGFERYEVSNYARPGAACLHNLAYWRNEQWLAAGPSASGHAGGHRWKNVPRLDDYLLFDDAGYAPIVDHEPPDVRRALRELIMGGVRVAEGLDLAQLDTLSRDAARSIAHETQNPASAEDSEKLREAIIRSIEREVRDGLLEVRGDCVAPTARGMNFADGIARRLMAASTPQ